MRPNAGLRVNNGLVMRDAALAGLGITLLASFVIHKELASGALRVLDVGAEPEGADIFIAYPQNRGASAKVRALIKCLREAFGDPPYWDLWTAGALKGDVVTRALFQKPRRQSHS